jgi:hypothetical protein
MQTGAWRVAGLEVIQQGTLFFARQCLTTFDSQRLTETRGKFQII